MPKKLGDVEVFWQIGILARGLRRILSGTAGPTTNFRVPRYIEQSPKRPNTSHPHCVAQKRFLMFKILDWNNSDDTRDIVHIVVQALVEGRRVALPADRLYHVVVSGLKGTSSAKLLELSSTGKIGRGVLILRSAQELLDYVTEVSPVASRMSQRGWPGALVLDLPVSMERGLLGRLPEEVRSLVSQENRAAFRCVSHPSIQQAMRLMSGPLIAAPIQLNGKPVLSADKAGELAEASIVVDDRQASLGEFPTVVRVDENRCQVLQPGAVAGDSLYRLPQFVILLVCTGNTCRSPMAEVLMRDKFHRRFAKSSANGSPVFIASGGLSAYPGGPASVEAQRVIAARGLSLSEHQSRAVTKHALQLADLVLVMTKSHRQALLDSLPEIKPKVHLLSGDTTDVADPFGGTESQYAACADQMDGFLDRWVQQLPDSYFPFWK